jgi:uncharacterized protein YkwD
MTTMLKGLASLIAVLSVGLGVGHATVTIKPVHHATAPAPVASTATFDPVGTDAFTVRGTTRVTVLPPTPAPVEPPPAAASDAQPTAAPAPAPRPAAPPIVVGSTQQALINQDRAGAGLGSLTWNSCLAGIAYQNAARMANQGAISHAGGPNQDLGCGLGNRAGENVGFWSAGISDSRLNTMFMNSPDHRANIMGPYRYVGTAWVVARNGYAYIAVEFS